MKHLILNVKKIKSIKVNYELWNEYFMHKQDKSEKTPSNYMPEDTKKEIKLLEEENKRCNSIDISIIIINSYKKSTDQILKLQFFRKI